MMKSDASLRGKVKAVAKRCGIRPQEVLQMYLFEHLLLRLSKSEYADKFVLKGGMLIAAFTGVARRTTMDMDTTVVGMSAEKESVIAAVDAICSTTVEDGMTYQLERVEPIREDDKYANWRAHIKVLYGRIDAPIKLDITTGDVITPQQAEYEYPLMFDEGTVGVMVYPLVTVLAEKFEAVVSRGTANTRGRDFYDIFSLMRIKEGSIDPTLLRQAVAATAAKRGTTELMGHYEERLEEVRASQVMRRDVWEKYVASAPYAEGIDFDEVVDAALKLGNLAVG